jgi:cyclopropane-fatty-acyl-phospholipid synthase
MGMVNRDQGGVKAEASAFTTRRRTASLYERLVASVFLEADVRLDGGRAWDFDVRDDRFYHTVLLKGSLGLGESYVDGWWTCRDLEELIYRLLRSGVERHNRYRPSTLWLAGLARLTNRQTRRRGMKVAEEHYNLGDRVFSFLGHYKNYSCGYFEGTDDLDVAQRLKLELLCRKLNLQPGERLLDVGGGWGEFARYAAKHYGVEVVSINIADDQIRFAREYCAGHPVKIVKCDYRDATGTYDKIAAIAMLPHVGPRNYREFMQVMHDRLTPNGTLLIECTGGNQSRAYCEPWTNKCIFSGGTIPSLKQLGEAMERLFVLEDLHNFAPSYVHTLRGWHANFQKAWPEMASGASESFRRTFEYFFLSCAAAFRARDLQYWHLVLTKPGTPQPACRLTSVREPRAVTA